MLQNTTAKKKMLKDREEYLQMLLFVSTLYKNETDKEKQKFYMDFILWLGKITKRIKDDLDDEDYSRYKYYEDMTNSLKIWNEEREENLKEEIEYIKRFPKLYHTFSRKDLYPEEYFTGQNIRPLTSE